MAGHRTAWALIVWTTKIQGWAIILTGTVCQNIFKIFTCICRRIADAVRFCIDKLSDLSYIRYPNSYLSSSERNTFGRVRFRPSFQPKDANFLSRLQMKRAKITNDTKNSKTKQKSKYFLPLFLFFDSFLCSRSCFIKSGFVSSTYALPSANNCSQYFINKSK